jgi:hypothetical protein
MQTTLVVVRAFGSHAIGDLVMSPSEITQILASEHVNYVVQMVPPAAPLMPPEA